MRWNKTYSKDIIRPNTFLHLLEESMVQGYKVISVYEDTLITETHRKNISEWSNTWNEIYTNKTCLMCLARVPQYRLHCGHYICENCVVVFGEKPEDNYFKVEYCFLCGRPTYLDTIKIHPPTTGASILCIDGGGIRGLIPLKFLELLQENIGIPIPIIRLFKLVFGTSSGKYELLIYLFLTIIGGIIALELSVNGNSVQKAISTFIASAQVAFRKRTFPPRILPCSSILDYIISLAADCRYPEKNIEAALKSVFSSTKTMLDISYASRHGIRVGVPVATADGPSLGLFTNYNSTQTNIKSGKTIEVLCSIL
jgi:hypothetical protein